MGSSKDHFLFAVTVTCGDCNVVEGKMRKRVILLFLAIFGVALSVPAFAQRVNPVAEAKWQRFLANHPGVQAGMVNNPNYLASHPGIATWLRDHPDVSMY